MFHQPKTLALALTLALSAVSAPALRAQDAATDKYEKAFELKGIDKIRVQNVNGTIRIATWDKDYVRVSAVKKARGARAAEALRNTEIRVSKKGSLLDIETILPRSDGSWGFFSWGKRVSADVSYELLSPASVSVDAETVNGRISTEGRKGHVAVSTVNGSVKVESQAGGLKVNTVNGSVDVAFSGAFHRSDVETVNGSVTVSAAGDSSIRYQLQTVNGRIESEFPDLTVEGKWGPKTAHGSVNGGKEELNVETVNGEVRLVVTNTRETR